MYLRSYVFLVLILSATHPARAQYVAHTFIGILGNDEFGSPTTMNRDAGVIRTFGTQGIGLSWDNAFGASFYLQKPQFFSEKFGLSLLGGYSSSSGEFKSNYIQAPTAVKDFRVISKTKKIGIETFATFSFSPKFFIGGGVWGNYRLKNDITQHLEGIDPPRGDTIIASGEAISTSKFHYGIPLILGGRFPASDLISFNIETYGKIDLGEIFRGYAKQALSSGIRLGVSFSIDTISVPAPPLPIPETAVLLTSVHFTTNGKSIKTIIAHPMDTISTFYHMLPSRIYFETGRDLLRSSSFLDIIGKRMHDMSESELQISSSSLNAESDERAIKRALHIEEYLDSAWEIPRSRIRISTIHTQERSYCELSDNSKILSPVTDEITQRSLAVSSISLSRFISSQAGIRLWRASIRDDNKVIARFSSEDSLSADDPVLTLPDNDKVLFAELHVTDNLGQTHEAFDTLEIRLANDETPLYLRKDVFLLLPDSSENSKKWIVPLQEKISQIISEKSIVCFQPLRQEDAQFIQSIAGKFLSELKLNPVAKVEIITVPYKVGTSDLWKNVENAFVVTIIN